MDSFFDTFRPGDLWLGLKGSLRSLQLFQASLLQILIMVEVEEKKCRSTITDVEIRHQED